MLPFGAQGSNMALEDAGALGELFRDVHSPALVPERLALFGRVRRLRASRVQILSRVRLGKEMEVQAQLRKFADPAGGGTVFDLFLFFSPPTSLAWPTSLKKKNLRIADVPRSFAERQIHDYG